MRRLLFTTTLALLLLQLLGCSGGCLALYPTEHRCMYHEMTRGVNSPPAAIVQELPRKGQGGWRAYTTSAGDDGADDWAPIRIVVSEKDLDDPTKHCTKEGERRPTFRGYDMECQWYDVLTSRTRTKLLRTILPEAIKLHSDRLAVQPMTSPLIVPRSIQESQCKHFTVPEEHYTTGVQDADTVLYLAVGTHMTFTVPCVAATEGVRPTVGAMSFNLAGVLNTWFAVRVAAHEIAHVLGFTYEQMSAQKMLRTVSTDRFNQEVGIVTSETTKQKAQEHYNCASIEGMTLRNEYDETLLRHSHWDQRYAKDELMSSAVTSGAGFYTALTMAAFADMGFFRVNFSRAETMGWGKDVGCGFVDQKQCMPDDHEKYPKMFCRKNTSDTTRHCTSDRVHLGSCESSSDGQCLVIHPVGFGSCRDETSSIHGGRMGPSSWCLDGDSLLVNVEALGTQPQVVSVGGVCVEVLCGENNVRVRYLGDDDWYNCPEGGHISPANTSADFAGGRIKCPSYSEVCTITPSGRSGLLFDANGVVYKNHPPSSQVK